MKRILQSVFILIFSGLAVVTAQDLENGEIAINLSDYGRVRIYSPDFTLRRIDRAGSINRLRIIQIIKNFIGVAGYEN